MLAELNKVWIVGASTGIGLALTKALDSPNRTLALSARSEDKLVSVAADCQSQSLIKPVDITDEYAVGAAAQSLAEEIGALDMVIVNAGTCEYIDGPYIDLECVKRVMDTNFWGALHVVNAALPLLEASQRQGKRPKLVIMSSSVTYQALPRAHAYGASKAALRYFSDCLRVDLEAKGIDLQVISPGFVKTPLTDLNDFPMPFRIEADEAAQQILKGLEADTYDIHFPKRFTRALKTLAVLPDSLRFNFMRKMARDKPTEKLENPL